MMVTVVLISCDTPIKKGIRKDFNTNLSTHYHNMVPEKVMLTMNGEVLNHTDIPIGESFLLINDGITGLVEKDGKVAVGCSLEIKDKNSGKILLKEADLFEGRELFDKDSARMLKCTINTGLPMQWETLYDVKVKFWDKYGNGELVNNVTIRCIDIP